MRIHTILLLPSTVPMQTTGTSPLPMANDGPTASWQENHLVAAKLLNQTKHCQAERGARWASSKHIFRPANAHPHTGSTVDDSSMCLISIIRVCVCVYPRPNHIMLPYARKVCVTVCISCTLSGFKLGFAWHIF